MKEIKKEHFLSESKGIVRDITLSIQSGGMLEFEKTGIYPEYLLFHSLQLRRTWRFKQLKDIQNGVLKVNGLIAFHYFYDESGCRIQTVTNGVVIDEWEVAMISMQMRD
jgi:hypothetical protein